MASLAHRVKLISSEIVVASTNCRKWLGLSKICFPKAETKVSGGFLLNLRAVSMDLWMLNKAFC